jgi:hypothetical protein
MKIEIKYNGSYPNLCRGKLTVIIDGIVWDFPDYCLESGGSVSFDSEWHEVVSSGNWDVGKWPDNFPDNVKPAVLSAINEEIPLGCCGGCV